MGEEDERGDEECLGGGRGRRGRKDVFFACCFIVLFGLLPVMKMLFPA